MNIIFFGRGEYATKALQYTLAQEHSIACVVTPENDVLAQATRTAAIPCVHDQINAQQYIAGVDLVISYLYPKRIKPPFLTLGRGAINFHPAPLPQYGGFAPYSFGIVHGGKEWGVTAHYMDEGIDTGDVAEVRRFPIDLNTITAGRLKELSMPVLLQLYQDILGQASSGAIPRHPQTGTTYYSKKDFEQLRQVTPADSARVIDAKVRAFFAPPFSGAYRTLGHTLMNAQMARRYPLARPVELQGQRFYEIADEDLAI